MRASAKGVVKTPCESLNCLEKFMHRLCQHVSRMCNECVAPDAYDGRKDVDYPCLNELLSVICVYIGASVCLRACVCACVGFHGYVKVCVCMCVGFMFKFKEIICTMYTCT